MNRLLKVSWLLLLVGGSAGADPGVVLQVGSSTPVVSSTPPPPGASIPPAPLILSPATIVSSPAPGCGCAGVCGTVGNCCGDETGYKPGLFARWRARMSKHEGSAERPCDWHPGVCPGDCRNGRAYLEIVVPDPQQQLMASPTGSNCAITIVVQRTDSSVISVVLWIQASGTGCNPPDSLDKALLAGWQKLPPQNKHPNMFFSDSILIPCPTSRGSTLSVCAAGYRADGSYITYDQVDFTPVLRK
jgi:hypothetical protein